MRALPLAFPFVRPWLQPWETGGAGAAAGAMPGQMPPAAAGAGGAGRGWGPNPAGAGATPGAGAPGAAGRGWGGAGAGGAAAAPKKVRMIALQNECAASELCLLLFVPHAALRRGASTGPRLLSCLCTIPADMRIVRVYSPGSSDRSGRELGRSAGGPLVRNNGAATGGARIQIPKWTSSFLCPADLARLDPACPIFQLVRSQ